jgi:hypothetical protein
MPNDKRLEAMEERVQWCERMIAALSLMFLTSKLTDETIRCPYCRQDFNWKESVTHFADCLRDKS